MGHPDSLARVTDELYCLSNDFPSHPLELPSDDDELNEDEPDDRVLLAAAVDLFAGASFASRNKPEQRDRFIIGIVRAIENATAFPVTFSSEAATYIGEGDGSQSILHASIVIANACQRLIDRDQSCVPLVPCDIRRRLECLALQWMHDNPVDAFFVAISGPKLSRIVHWEDPARTQPDDARVGDQVTLLVNDFRKDDGMADLPCVGQDLADYGVMFSPYAPAPVVRVIDDGVQVLVPRQARTGPVAILKRNPDLTHVEDLLSSYQTRYPVEWSLSIFTKRIETWAFPTAFGRPIIEILQTPDEPIDRTPPNRPESGPPAHLPPNPPQTQPKPGAAVNEPAMPQPQPTVAGTVPKQTEMPR